MPRRNPYPYPTYPHVSFSVDTTGDDAIARLNEQYQLYTAIEQQLLQKRGRLMGKLPEIQQALDAVTLLIKKRDAEEEVRGYSTQGSTLWVSLFLLTHKRN